GPLALKTIYKTSSRPQRPRTCQRRFPDDHQPTALVVATWDSDAGAGCLKVTRSRVPRKPFRAEVTATLPHLSSVVLDRERAREDNSLFSTAARTSFPNR